MKQFKIFAMLMMLMFTACNDDFLNVDPLDIYSGCCGLDGQGAGDFVCQQHLSGQYYGFHTVMFSSLCDEAMEVWSWESQPVVKSEINPSYLGILGPGFWIYAFNNVTWNRLYKNIRACNIFFECGEVRVAGMT